MRRRSFLAAVIGLPAAALGQSRPRRSFGCTDHDPGDPAWAHGADRDVGPRGDPVARFLYQDGGDRGGQSDAGSHARNRPQVFCPRKRQIRARG
jgi:hypothetical protein